MNNLNLEIQFKELPYWRGVVSNPTRVDVLPFALTWDGRGFIRQVPQGEIQKKIVNLYATEEYKYITPPPGASPWANRLGDAALDFIKKAYGSLKGKKILEIGAGSLYTAHKLLEAGATDYTIFDPGIKEVSNDPRIQIIKQYFTDDTRPTEKYDLVISVNCLEHVEDPVNFLVNLQQVLKNSKGQGILIFPDVEQQFRNGDLNVIIHEHLNYFTKVSSYKLLENCGFKIHETELTFDRFCVLLSADDKPQVKTDLPMEEVLPIGALAFHRSVEYVTRQIEEGLSKNQRVGFYGANNGLNNALYFTRALEHTNLCIFDSDVTKTGKYIPAFNNPICSPTDTKDKELDRVFVSALSFYPEIRNFLISKGGVKPSSVFPFCPMA